MFEILNNATRGNQVLAWQARFTDLRIGVDAGDDGWTITIRNGEVAVASGDEGPHDLRLKAQRESWDKFFKALPPVGFQTLGAMFTTHQMDVVGDYLKFARYMFLIEGIFAAGRPSAPLESVAPFAEPRIEDVTGRYLHMNVSGRPHRVYFEEAGHGIPLLCLHTAGADGRQYRALLNDPEITARFRVIAFDLPWHGKSSPPPGFQTELYSLTTDRYVETIMSFKRALKLDAPVVMGCSIGGRAVLHLALRHGEEFRAAIGLQSALHAEVRPTEGAEGRLYRPDVNGSELCAATVAGVMAPGSRPSDAWETLWHYMQGGPGIFMGDLFYYLSDGDLRNGQACGIDTTKCPLYLLTGEYDLSATPEMTAELARQVKATSFEIMKELGHFPMSESPEKFRRYIMPILERIAGGAHLR
ncbi:alpha/beta fold hydrolase [Tardiphaga sp. 215_C5_N2_1]|uniref:alpha/beta fold hydrolase n=1 Tax=Tardiphaga sp. 215_C5_N2_1 TaxID=3240774 RepID=UPI003F88E085